MKKLLVLVVLIATAAGISVAVATASSAPIVITYEKTCGPGGCAGSTGNGGTITMTVTGRPTGEAAQLEISETITGGGGWFTADLSAHFSPAGFIVLNGIVTDSSDPSLVGAQVHQRSNLDPGSATHWTGELQLMPASA